MDAAHISSEPSEPSEAFIDAVMHKKSSGYLVYELPTSTPKLIVKKVENWDFNQAVEFVMHESEKAVPGYVYVTPRFYLTDKATSPEDALEKARKSNVPFRTPVPGAKLISPEALAALLENETRADPPANQL